MNIFRNQELQIDYNVKINRISIQNTKKGFVSCTLSSFQILICLLKHGSPFEEISINQMVSILKISKIGGNISLQFESKTHASVLILKYSYAEKIIEQSENALVRIGLLKSRFGKLNTETNKETQDKTIENITLHDDDDNHFEEKKNESTSLTCKRPSDINNDPGKMKKSRSVNFSPSNDNACVDDPGTSTSTCVNII